MGNTDLALDPLCSVAFTPALVAAIVAFVVRLAGYGPSENAQQLVFAYGIVGFAIGFSLVIRAGISYERFWTARQHLATMQSRICDLAIFTRSMCKRPDKIKVFDDEMRVNKAFQEEMSRLLQLYVKVMLQRLGQDPDDLWDYDGQYDFDTAMYDLEIMLTDSEMKELKRAADKGWMVMNWITDYACASKEWNVPPPVKSMFNVYQTEVLKAYNDSMMIADTTVPFPMVHIGMTILTMFYISWPFLMALLCKSIYWAMLISFVPILAFFAVNAIAIELQDPYGDDDNDLPLRELHLCICRDIRIILEPWNVNFDEADPPGSRGPHPIDDG